MSAGATLAMGIGLTVSAGVAKDGHGAKSFFLKVGTVYGLGGGYSAPQVEVHNGTLANVLKDTPASGGGAARTITGGIGPGGSVELTPNRDGSASFTGGGTGHGPTVGLWVQGASKTLLSASVDPNDPSHQVAGQGSSCKKPQHGSTCK